MNSSKSYSTRPKPLSINELLNNDDNYTPEFPPFEEQINIHSHIQKLINRTKNIEAEMIRNYNHGKILFNEFFRLLETTEMVAFDIMYVDCLWGAIEFKDFYDFIQRCRDATFVFDRPTDQDIQQAAEHIKYLHSIIRTCCNDFRDFEPSIKIEPPLRPYKIYTYLDDLKKTIELDILKIPEMKKHEQAELEYDYGFDASIFNTTSVHKNSEKFNEWLMDFVQPNRDSNAIIAPNRALLGLIFHKMNFIQKLKEELEEIKKDTISPKYIGPLDLDPQSIQNSPYYKAAIGNASFLRESISNFLSEQTKINTYEESIEKIVSSSSKLQNPCQETLKSVEKIQKAFRERIAKEHNDLQAINNENKPFQDLSLNDTNIEKIEKLIEDIKNLDSEVTNLLKSEQSKQASLNNTSAASKISDFIEYLQELSGTRVGLIELCKECAKERKDESKIQKMLFNVVEDYAIQSEILRNYKRFTEVSDDYQPYLEEVFKLFDKDTVFQWCEKVNAALDEMQEALTERERLDEIGEKDDLQSDSIADDEDQIKQLELEIERLEKELADVDYEKVKLDQEVNMKTEELFEQIQLNDMYIIYQGSNLQKTKKLKDFKEAIICSECKERVCDVVINKKNCNHAFCRKCIELDSDKENGKCPICGTQYSNEMILDFSFNPKHTS